MKKPEIQKCLETGRLQLSKWELFYHYSGKFFVFFLLLPAFAFSKEPNRLWIWAGFALSILVYLFSKHMGLRFKKIEGHIDSDSFRKAAKATAIEHGFRFKSINAHHFRANVFSSMSGISIRFTVIRTENELFLNLISEPDGLGSSFTFFTESKYENTFLRNLFEAQKGKNVIEIAEKVVEKVIERIENGPEWSVEMILKRIWGWSIAALFVFLSVIFIREGQFPAPIIVALILVGVYLWADVSMILRKWRQPKKP